MSNTGDGRALRASAEEAVRAGLAVIALYEVTFTPLPRCGCWRGEACDRIGKHPDGGKGWQQRGITDERAARLIALGSGGGLGVLTGSPSGVVVLDVDVRNGGDISLAALEARRGPLPRTRRVISGRRDGGVHLYYSIPSEVKVSSKKRLGTGIDVLSDGFFVVAPPSISMHGMRRPYLLDPSAPVAIAPFPRDLLELLVDRAPPGPTFAERVGVLGDVVEQATLVAILFRDAVSRVALAPEGSRNTTLNGEAYGLGSLVAAGYLDAESVAFELVRAAGIAGLKGEASFATVLSGLGDGADATVPGAGAAVDALMHRARSAR